jgi:hypothetical protein
MLPVDAWLDEKPYREVFDDVVHAKVSRRRAHASVALHAGELLNAWGGQRGGVAVEAAFPGLQIPVSTIFSPLDRRRT